MEDYLVKANQALMEGDRDGALKFIEGCPPSVDVLWIRAQCVTNERERISLLEEIFNSEHPDYACLAGGILERERDFSTQLSQPPEYQFWKKPTWMERLQQLKKQRGWIIGIIGMLLMSVLVVGGLSISGKQAQLLSLQATQTMQAVLALPTATLRLTPSVTPIPEMGPVIYPGGQFSIIRFERGTNRMVISAGSYGQQQAAVPAAGAEFWAFEYKFICRKAVCDNPPEVEKVTLQLAGGGERDSTQFVLADFPAAARVAEGIQTTGWLVFEVPQNASPEKFRLVVDRDQIFDLDWKP